MFIALHNYNFKYHNELAPKIWLIDRHINPSVRQSLLMLMWDFVAFMSNNGMPITIGDVHDIIVHGSIADYYYDQHSDIDVCIIADMTKWHATLGNINTSAVYKSLLHSWKRSFYISIYGRNIDVTLADFYNPQYGGTFYKVGSAYSLMSNNWIRMPARLRPDAIHAIRRKARIYAKLIISRCRLIIKNKMNYGYIDAMFDNLRQERISQMQQHFAQPITPETMGFKMARNTGIFRKIRKIANQDRSRNFNM